MATLCWTFIGSAVLCYAYAAYVIFLYAYDYAVMQVYLNRFWLASLATFAYDSWDDLISWRKLCLCKLPHEEAFLDPAAWVFWIKISNASNKNFLILNSIGRTNAHSMHIKAVHNQHKDITCDITWMIFVWIYINKWKALLVT